MYKVRMFGQGFFFLWVGAGPWHEPNKANCGSLWVVQGVAFR